MASTDCVRLGEPPRMADFAIWVNACEESLGMKPGEALTAYQSNCAEARNLALEASPVYEPLREVARAGFSGTSSELLFLLSKLASDSTRRSRRWPNRVLIKYRDPQIGRIQRRVNASWDHQRSIRA